MLALNGALSGVRIIELAGIGPAPFAGMMLADHGAEVIRVERPGARPSGSDVLARNRRVIGVDLKRTEGVALVRDLARHADGLIEGFRPGVMERLGLGPDVLLADNAKLVFGRMTGWGQTGPLARTAGHDIDYIAIAGALHAYGRAGERPTPPINMVGDFGGGGMLLAFGMVSALLHAARTGVGQVVDCAMVDGAALLMSMIWGFRAAGAWRDERGVNMLDTGAHFYDTYETADGKLHGGRRNRAAILCRAAAVGWVGRRGAGRADGCCRVAGSEGARGRRLFARGRAMIGVRFSMGRTRVSRRCCRWARRRGTRIMRRGAFSWRLGVLCSLPRRPGIQPRRQGCR